MTVTVNLFQRLSLEDPEGHWELHAGRILEKPIMSAGHNRAIVRLTTQLVQQVDPEEFDVRGNTARTSRADEVYYIPDVMVIPAALVLPFLVPGSGVEVYDAPLPLIVEVWSPSTGGYDVDAKLPEYQRRGDLEIWRRHPFDRTLTIWRRQVDGSYEEETVRGGTVCPIGLPGVVINLDALFV